MASRPCYAKIEILTVFKKRGKQKSCWALLGFHKVRVKYVPKLKGVIEFKKVNAN